MGLWFSHGEAQWSYGGFQSFRERLAAEIGINLGEMEGFDGSRSWKSINDPIAYLLNRCDTDGWLSPKQCRLVAPRLRKLVKDWSQGHDKNNALELAKGMSQAARQGKRLLFR